MSDELFAYIQELTERLLCAAHNPNAGRWVDTTEELQKLTRIIHRLEDQERQMSLFS